MMTFMYIGLYEQQKYIIHVIKTVENNRRKGNGKKDTPTKVLWRTRNKAVQQEDKHYSKVLWYPTYMIPTRKRCAFSELLGTLNDDKSSFSF